MNIKKFIVAASLLFSNATIAAENVEVIVPFGFSASSVRVLSTYVEELNKLQDKYNFKIAVSPGAKGENAVNRSVALSERNIKNLLFIYPEPFTRKQNFKIDDFYPIISFNTSFFVLSINQKHEANTVSEFVESLKKKNVIYLGDWTSATASQVLSRVFLKKYGLFEKTKTVTYKDNFDMKRGVINGEVDFAVFSSGLESGTKTILSSGAESKKIKEYANIPSGTDVGIDEFEMDSILFFAVPNNIRSFGEELHPLLTKMCGNPNVEKVSVANLKVSTCYGEKKIVQIIKNYDNWMYSKK